MVLSVLCLPNKPPRREPARPRAPPTKAPGTPPTAAPLDVGSGAAASAAESAQMMPTDYSFIGDAANQGLAAYNTIRSVDAPVSLQKSQENVNKSIEGVNMAQKGLMESQTDTQKMTYKFAQDTYLNRLLQEQFKAELENWRGFDAMYAARLKAFSLYNVMPQEVEKNVAQTMSFYATAYRDWETNRKLW